MTLFEQILKDRQLARLAKDDLKSTVLTVLAGEVERLKGKEEITDTRVVAIVKKMLADNEQVLLVTTREHIRDVVKEEAEILTSYLPKQLTDQEIATIIASNDLNSIKEVMQFFKTNYAGQYDGKQVKEIFTKE